MSTALLTTPSTPDDNALATEPEFSTAAAAHAWSRVKLEEKLKVLRWAGICAKICKAAHGAKGALVKRAAAAEKVQTSTVQNYLKKWRDSGGSLLALVNHARVRDSVALNETFTAWFAGIVAGYQRGNVALRAHRALINRWDRWRAGDDTMAIPGYAECPVADFGSNLPAGWSYNNLLRFKPNKYQATLIRQGPQKASSFLPPVRASREGTKVGQIIMWDDHWGDTLVIHPGDASKEPVRPVGYFSMDYTSGCLIDHWWKPMRRRASDGTREYLSQADFYWYLLHHLSTRGVRTDTGTMFVVEHGTAAIRENSAMEEGLQRVLGDTFSIDRSGRYGKPAFRGLLYPGPGSGNFRRKANLESFFNLLENASSAIPGQSGRNPDEKPEEQYGLKLASTWYLNVLESTELSVERKMNLIAPTRFFQDFTAQSKAIIRALNGRHDHHLGQWEECEFMRTLYQFAGEWVDMPQILQLPPATQNEVLQLSAIPHRMKRERMSPGEVWQAGSKALRKLSGPEIAGIVPESMMRVAKVTARMEFVIEDHYLGSEPLYYKASPIDIHGHRVQLTPGKEYLVILNPHSWDRIQVLGAEKQNKGVWLGECKETPRVSRLDHDGLAHSFGESMATMASQRADAERMVLSKVLSRQADKTWNDRLIKDKSPLTPSEKSAAAARMEVAEAMKQFATEEDNALCGGPATGAEVEGDSAPWSDGLSVAAALAGLPHDDEPAPEDWNDFS